MKKLIILGVVLFVTACGFRPLYNNTNTFAGDGSVLQQIWIKTLPGETGIELRNALIDRFYNNGYPTDPHYTLDVTIALNGRDVVIERNDTTTRTQLVLTANYTLKERDTPKIVESGTMRAIASYNILESQYTTTVTFQQAQSQALQSIADKIAMRMAVVLGDKQSN